MRLGVVQCVLLAAGLPGLSGQTVLVNESFNGNSLPASWTRLAGTATVANGSLILTDGCLQLPTTATRTSGLTIEFDATPTEFNDDINIWALFDTLTCGFGPTNGYSANWYPQSGNNQTDSIAAFLNGRASSLGTAATRLLPNQRARLRVEFRADGTIVSFVDGVQIISVTNQQWSQGRIAIGSLGTVEFDNFKVTGTAPGSSCSLSCTATAPTNGTANTAVSFSATATASGCQAAPSFAWPFGDGSASAQQNPSHTYSAGGTYSWGMTANVSGGPSCTKNGSVAITQQPAFSVSGIVTGATATVSITGQAITQEFKTSSSYTFTGLTNGTYTVTAAAPGYTFTPPSRTVTIAGANVTGINFAATVVQPSTFSISGNAGIGGAEVGISGLSAPSKSAGDGSYSVGGLTNGTYEVTPTLAGYTFTPASRRVVIAGANQANVNFTATALASGIEIIGFEVTQAVQNLRNSVTLIEGKPTVVRVHVRSTGNQIQAPDGKLELLRVTGSGTIRLSPAKDAPPVVVEPNPRRTNANSIFLFDLPSDWLEGTIELEFMSSTHKVTSSAPRTQPCEWDFSTKPVTRRCTIDNGPPDTKIQVSFSSAPHMKIQLGSVVWRDGDGVEHWPTLDDFEEVIHSIEQMYPIVTIDRSSNTFVVKPPPGPGGPKPYTMDEFDSLRWQISRYQRNNNCILSIGCTEIYLGILRDDGTTTLSANLDRIDGIAYIAGWSAVAFPTAVPHELGHTMGLSHMKCFGNEYVPDKGTGSLYPYEHGTFSPDLALTYPSPNALWGFRILENEAVPPDMDGWPNFRRLSGLNFYVGDVMGYCSTKWPSDYTYDYLRQSLLKRFGGTGLSAERMKSERLPASATERIQELLLITGSVTQDLSSATFRSVESMPTSSSLPPASGILRFVQFDRNGVEIGSYQFEPVVDPYNSETLRFTEVIPRASGLARLAIVANGRVIAERTASANAPVVRMIFPAGGESIDQGGITVRWDASDADGDKLTFVLQYSSDNGGTWNTIATDVEDTFAVVDLRQLRSSERGLFRVLASDGLLSAQAQTGAVFRVAATKPTASIASPISGSKVSALDVMTLRGSGFDPQEGVLPETALEWSSDLAGVLGTGRTVQLAENRLSPGTHHLTLISRNSAGETGTATVEVQVDANAVVPAVPKFELQNGYTFPASSLAPGSVATLIGTNLTTGVNGVVQAPSGALPRAIQGTSVSIDGQTAPLFWVVNVDGLEALRFQVPYELAPGATSQLVVTNNRVRSDSVEVKILAASPVLFTTEGSTGMIFHAATLQPVTAASPATPGETVVVYATGLGAVSPAVRSGSTTSASQVYSLVNPATVTIGGLSANVLFAGLSPGGSAGSYQIKVEIPAIGATGNMALRVVVADQESNPVTIAVSGSGSTCSYEITPMRVTFGAEGGVGTVGVAAPAGCVWTATSSTPWITITSDSIGNGVGTVSVTVAGNPASVARTGTLNVAGREILLTQAGVATGLRKVSGDQQTAASNQAFPSPLVVQTLTAEGQPLAGAAVTFVVTSGSATVAPGQVFSDASGRAQTVVTAGAASGAVAVEASSGGSTTTFNLTIRPPAPVLSTQSFVNGASGQMGLTPCALGKIRGVGLAPDLQGVLNASGLPLPYRLGSVEVTISGVPAPLSSISNVAGSEEIHLQVPCEVIPGIATVQLRTAVGRASVDGVNVSRYQPGVFERDETHAAVAIRPDGNAVTSANPARRGEVVTIYATGLGQTTPAIVTGEPGVVGQAVDGRIVVSIGDVTVVAESAAYLPVSVGVYAVRVLIPANAITGGARPLSIAVVGQDGAVSFSQGTTLPIQ